MGFRLPFFPMYAAETLADGRFQSWDLEARGAWITLLCANWNDGDIPESHTLMAGMLKVSTGDVARIWSAIGDRFSPVPGKPGRMWCPRLEDERAKGEALQAQRSKAGKRGATSRWHGENKPNGKRMRSPSRGHSEANAVALRSECDGNGLIPSPSPSPSHKEEASAAGDGVREVQHSDSPVAASLPCAGSARSYGVTLDQIASWQQAYPGVDVLAEVGKARVWLEANPNRRKTHGGMARFLVSWLGRAQDQPRQGKQQQSRPDLSTMDYTRIPEL